MFAGSPSLLSLSGPSGSGKTEIAGIVARRLGVGIPVVPVDAYYRDISHLPPADRAAVNFDDPDAIDLELFLRHLHALASGSPIELPTYDFNTHTRGPYPTRVVPGRYVVIEGLFALTWPEARAFYDLSVYIDAADELCLQRRIARDVRTRGRSEESVRAQWEATVAPMAAMWVRPMKEHADLVIDGSQPAVRCAERIVQALPTD